MTSSKQCDTKFYGKVPSNPQTDVFSHTNNEISAIAIKVVLNEGSQHHIYVLATDNVFFYIIYFSCAFNIFNESLMVLKAYLFRYLN